MKFGHFDDAQREYVITTPKTPLPWINYLGSRDFFSLISNTAGGYSFYKDAKLLRLTRYRYNNCPLDQGGRYYYIKDGDSIWNPGWQPTQTELDAYSCRHGLGYTVISGLKNGIEAELTAFVETAEQKSSDVTAFLNVIKQYEHITVLTPKIMHELIDRIVVHEPDKSSGKRVQDIEIHFRFDVAVSTISVETGKYGKKVA